MQFPVLLWHGIWEANRVWVVRTSSVDTTGCTHVNASLDISSVKTPKSWCTMQTPEIYAQVLCFGGPNEKTWQWWVEDGWGWLCLWWLSWSSLWSWSSWNPSKRQRGLSPIFLDGPGEGRGARALREGGEDMSSSSSSSSSSFCSIFYMHVYIACEFSILILGGCLKHKNALTFSVFVQIFSCCLHVLLYTYT